VHVPAETTVVSIVSGGNVDPERALAAIAPCVTGMKVLFVNEAGVRALLP